MDKLLVYVCSPLTGDIEKNVKYAVSVCSKLLQKGYHPICSHALTYMAYGLIDEKIALGYSKRLVKLCNVVYCPLPITTAGMKVEIEYAAANGISVVYNKFELEMFAQNQDW